MIKKETSRIKRPTPTKEQLIEDFKRLSNIGPQKESKTATSNLLKTQKLSDGRVFAVVQENKNYFIKVAQKEGDAFKYIGGLENRGKQEMYPSYMRASNRLNLICETLDKKYVAEKKTDIVKSDAELEDEKNDDLTEPSTGDDVAASDTDEISIDDDSDESSVDVDSTEGEIEDTDTDIAPEETGEEMGSDELSIDDDGNSGVENSDITSDETESSLLDTLDTKSEPEGSMDTPDMGDSEMGSNPEMGGGSPDMSNPEMGGASPDSLEGGLDDLGQNLDGSAAAPEMGGSEDQNGGESEDSTKKEFQKSVGTLGQLINQLKDRNQFEKGDIKNLMNSMISAVGNNFSEVDENEKEEFFERIRKNGAELNDGGEGDPTMDSETPETSEKPALPPNNVDKKEGKPNLSEGFLTHLKAESKTILLEMINKKLAQNKKQQLIESIQRKIK